MGKGSLVQMGSTDKSRGLEGLLGAACQEQKEHVKYHLVMGKAKDAMSADYTLLLCTGV